MPTPTIPAGNLFMNATLYTANGGTPQSITNGVSGQSFAPDFVWVKTRSVSNYHGLADSVRGVNKALFCNVTDAESTASSNYVTSFDTNGFSINQGGVFNGSSGTTMVAWQWKAGGTAVTNTAGSITSQVSANTTSGFSVVTWVGPNNNTTSTVGHGLGVAPSMVIYKSRNSATYWNVWHSSFTGGQVAYLNTTLQVNGDTNVFNNTVPSSTLLTVKNVEVNSSSMVAYCWAQVAGFSYFGTYTGNGSTDGPFVYTGFRPKFFMIKSTAAGLQWELFDSTRFEYNGMNNPTLYANSADAETSNSENYCDFLSNGLKIRATNGNMNANGNSYFFMAFAENPFKFSNAR